MANRPVRYATCYQHGWIRTDARCPDPSHGPEDWVTIEIAAEGEGELDFLKRVARSIAALEEDGVVRDYEQGLCFFCTEPPGKHADECIYPRCVAWAQLEAGIFT